MKDLIAKAMKEAHTDSKLSTALRESYLVALASRLESPDRLRAVWNTSFLERSTHDKLGAIVSTASMLLGAPYGNVTMLGTDGNFVVVSVPDDVPTAGAGHQDQEASFCQHVSDGEPFVVDDATVNLLVCVSFTTVVGGVRSYLGVPVTWGDEVVGSLCVFDVKSRSWSQADVRMLAALALSVEEVLA